MCDGADAAEVAGPADIRREAEQLWAFHMRRLSPRTPPERLVDRVAFSQDPPWRVVQCRACGCVYRSPAEHRNTLRAAYADVAPERSLLQALHDTQRRSYRVQARRLGRLLARRGSGLEVGSYVGAFLSAARDARWTFEGLDVNPHTNAFARSLGFVVHDGDLEHFASDGERRYDAVAIWNTFDQLPDPRAALRRAWQLLRDDGVLAIRVPNGACYARWRTRLEGETPAWTRALAVQLLAQNNLLTFPYRYGFTPTALGRLLNRVGFAVERVVPDVLVPTADEWTRRWAALEERMVKPWTRRFAPWFEIYARRT